MKPHYFIVEPFDMMVHPTQVTPFSVCPSRNDIHWNGKDKKETPLDTFKGIPGKVIGKLADLGHTQYKRRGMVLHAEHLQQEMNVDFRGVMQQIRNPLATVAK